MKKLITKIMMLAFFACTLNLNSFSQQADPINAPDFGTTTPVFDGIADDALWADLPWQPINQMWIKTNVTLTAADFSGRFKTAWSESNNMLYFLAETTDDFFADGYVCGNEKYPDYDILEIFIDPDNSGGDHLMDGTGNVWGSFPRGNGENAFSYHIAINQPADNASTSTYCVMDLGGTSTDANPIRKDYSAHIDNTMFSVHRTGNTYTWEFALKVYDDTYTDASPETSRKILELDDLIGISLAYCDNDQDDALRDNFIGSTVIDAADVNNFEYNSCWYSANDYGNLKLVAADYYVSKSSLNLSSQNVKVYPNPASDQLTIEINDQLQGMVQICVYEITGKKMAENTNIKNSTCQLDVSGFAKGMYILQIKNATESHTQKFEIR